jgi:hypothetical protein
VFAEKHCVNRVGEKSPGHIHYLRILKDRYPQAKFIHVIRDPRAVISSHIKSFESKNVAVLCGHWRSAIEVHTQYADELGSTRYMAIKYEDLVNYPEPNLRAACDFLDLEFSPQMVEHHTRQTTGFNKRYQNHMSNTLKPVFTSSIEKWNTELTQNQIGIIQYALVKEMKLMGYEPLEVKHSYPALRYKIGLSQHWIHRRYRKLQQKIKNLLKS